MNGIGSSAKRQGRTRRRPRRGACAKALALCLLLPSFPLPAHAGSPVPAAGQESAGQFQVTHSYCVMPCLNAAKERARSLESTAVTISRREVSGLMIPSCTGKLAMAVRETSRAEVMDELRRRYGDEAAIGAAQIALPAGSFKSGEATCTARGGASTTLARFLSIEPDRITLLTDSGVVYELSPGGGDATGSVTPQD